MFEKEPSDYRLTLQSVHDFPAAQVRLLHFNKPQGWTHQAGQYTYLSGTDGRPRPYSIGSAPDEKKLCFHIKLTDSSFSGEIADAREGHVVSASPAQGTSTLTPSTTDTNPLLIIAGSTGVAMALALINACPERQMSLLACARDKDGLYFRDLLPERKNLKTQLHIGPPDQVLGTDYPDLGNHIVFLAGPPAMAQACLPVLKAKNVANDQIRCDYDLE